jgi:hypothetical protein
VSAMAVAQLIIVSIPRSLAAASANSLECNAAFASPEVILTHGWIVGRICDTFPMSDDALPVGSKIQGQDSPTIKINSSEYRGANRVEWSGGGADWRTEEFNVLLEGLCQCRIMLLW